MRAEQSSGTGPVTAEMLCRTDESNPFRFRAAIVAAHPDDEVVGLGARLHRFADLRIIHTTDGAPELMTDALRNGFTKREDYSRARFSELRDALALAGIGMQQEIRCEVPDQAASYRLAFLARALRDFLDDFSPEVVITHPYEGGHPDHDATAFAVHAARTLMQKENRPVPSAYEFTSYHIRDGRIAVGQFIPYSDCRPSTALLSADEQQRKAKMIDCFATQREMLRSFQLQTESFRRSPAYDFTRPPHEGNLFYECFNWGITRKGWLINATEALQELGLASSNPDDPICYPADRAKSFQMR
jgi:LmbE family N-acetylglucosaminyl deacetylase